MGRVALLAATVVTVALAPALRPALTPHAHAAPTCPSGGCAVTVLGRDFKTHAALANYNFIVNVDNAKEPGAANNGALSTESHSPLVAEGDQANNVVHLDAGKYLISMRARDHKMWGAYFTLPQDADATGNLTEILELTTASEDHPLPLGKIRVFVFNDDTWTNGAPDTEEAGLPNFQVGLTEQTGSDVTVDYHNQPLCGGICKTGADGFVEISGLGPATYNIDVHPPENTDCNPAMDGEQSWTQTTTIDGGLTLLAPTEEGADGTGAPGEQLWEPPNNRTAYWFGFVCSGKDFANPGTGEITGTAKNWTEWAPYTIGTFTEPVANPFVALSDASTDQTVYVGSGDLDGNFDIQNVPAGDYNLAIWDEQLSYIMRFKSIHVDDGQAVDANETGDDGSTGVGVSRWFGWLDGTVYKDTNNNGMYDAGTDAVIPNTDMDQRWRDGSIKETTTTDAHGHYEYPTAEGGALGRWIINEQGFARFSAYPGPSVHDEHTGAVTPSCAVDTSDPTVHPANPCVPTDQGGGLLTNQLLLEGHRATVDWGKRDYNGSEPGQIVGITYFATTRNEFDARMQANEDYEPAIPGVTVYLETPGPDGIPNTSDDVVVNKYVTDHWQQPNASQDPQSNGDGGPNSFKQSCDPLRDFNGDPITNQFNANIGPNCLEVPLTGENTKDGAFDGGYAFADYCPDGYNLAANDGTCVGGGDPVPLVAGKYITHAIMPKNADDSRACNTVETDPNVSTQKGDLPGGGAGCLYRPVKEEDVNVDLGNQFQPNIPPPPCTGDDHVIDQETLVTRSNYYHQAGAHAPLCDKRLIVLQNGQNANADFHMMTNFKTDPNADSTDTTSIGDVAEPGRLVGQVFNDIYFERNPDSPWYGEPRPIANIPVGIYARVDTVDPATGAPDTGAGAPNAPYDANKWRLIKTVNTGPDGTYEALVPSTETFNCPIPQGPCPGMYLVTVDDPGTVDHKNLNYNPNLLTATTPAEAWPGLTDQLDTPVDPISGTGCEDPADPARPNLLQVSQPYVTSAATNTARRITIYGDFIGTGGTSANASGHIRLTDANGNVRTLSQGGTINNTNGGIVSWTPGSGATPDTIVVQIPAVSASFPAGPRQLDIVTSNNNGAVGDVEGITLHVLGTGYSPAVKTVPAPPVTPNDHTLQTAIDNANPGDLLVLSPGVYNENLLMWKPVKLQGLGPGGIIGSHELQARDPEDPRFNIKGTVIDGRYWQQNLTAFNGTVSAHAPYSGVDAAHPVLTGGDLTLVAKSTTAYGTGLNAARIDGVGLMTGNGGGAGGIQAQAYANNTLMTNNFLENNGGLVAGGIGLGQPFDPTSHNYDTKINHNMIVGNGALTDAGGIGIFNDSNNYDISQNVICANFSVNYGAGIGHIGLSPGGKIHDNQIYYNESADAGGGLTIQSELPVGGGLGAGSGTVDVDRNLIQSNYSGDDGGGIFVLNALKQPINIRDNQIVDNGAADLGGAVMLDDSSDVRIVNNTLANNVTTGSAEDSDGNPHGAGLTSEANEPAFQSTLPAGAPDFSRPTALFNNIFWNNDAMTLSSPGPGATLVDGGFIDLEIHGTTNNADTFTPRYSDLTTGNILGPNGVQHAVPAGQGNLVGVDPGFVTPFTLELTVSGSRLDPQTAAVTITGADPPVGLTGDYHLTTASPVVDRGVRCSNTAVPAPLTALLPCSGGGIQAPALTPAQGGLGDYDSQYRPQLRTLRALTPWDLGADELPGLPIPLINAAALAAPRPAPPYRTRMS